LTWITFKPSTSTFFGGHIFRASAIPHILQNGTQHGPNPFGKPLVDGISNILFHYLCALPRLFVHPTHEAHARARRQRA
jgi:hypothetical protein